MGINVGDLPIGWKGEAITTLTVGIKPLGHSCPPPDRRAPLGYTYKGVRSGEILRSSLAARPQPYGFARDPRTQRDLRNRNEIVVEAQRARVRKMRADTVGDRMS